MNTAERRHAAIEALESDAIQLALDELEREAVEVWSATDLSDAAKREISYFQLLGAKQLRGKLKNWSRETKKDGRQ